MSATVRELESKVTDVFRSFAGAGYRNRAFMSELWRDEHEDYLLKGIARLPASFTVLDSSRPWLCYWIVHSMALLGQQLDPGLQADAIEFLKHCQDPLGGYGGGPGQIAHLATTYAAVGTLVSIGGDQALESINRDKILDFMLRMKDPSGGFRMHDGGEMDVRGCYTAIAVAFVLNILVPPLLEKLGDYIASCQTYEGGIGGEPGAEAHGGYTYCGLAALIMANQVDSLDLPGLLNWVAFRQGKVEGGFQGRTNKLVDGCYSFWQGGAFPLLQQIVTKLIAQQTSGSSIMNGEPVDDPDVESGGGFMPSGTETFTAEKLFPARKTRNQQIRPFYNPTALQGYILLCCQVLNGGLIDKPGKSKDYYHTCYCLSGLSTAQHSLSSDPDDLPASSHIFGPYSNLLESTHPLLNFQMNRCRQAMDYYKSID